jgi:hypothetical protein
MSLPGQTVNIVDETLVIRAGARGVTGIQIATLWGPIHRQVKVSSWPEFVRVFGGLMTNDDGPLYAKRILERGGKLSVSRAIHYTDPTDRATAVGTKANGALGAATTLIQFESKWYTTASITCTTQAPLSGITGVFDLKVVIPGLDTQFVRDIPDAPTAAKIAEINAQLLNINIQSVGSGTTALGSIVLTGGAYDPTTIIAADLIGDAAAETGLYVFGRDPDIWRVAMPSYVLPTVDDALISYATTRGDILAATRTPIGISGATSRTYRNRTGSYTGSKPNSWNGLLFYGDFDTPDPVNPLVTKTLSVIGDVLGAISAKDNKTQPFISSSGKEYGKLYNNYGVNTNVGDPGQAGEAGAMYANGINPVIQHSDFGSVLWGNRTLYQDQTSMLIEWNVAELLIDMRRTLGPVIQGFLFKPNDIETWVNIYNAGQPYMRSLIDNRGIWKYAWEGDQNAKDITDVTVNNANDVNQGIYKLKIYVWPKVALQYLIVDITATNSNTIFEVSESVGS